MRIEGRDARIDVDDDLLRALLVLLELWLKSFLEIATLARLDPLDSPLVISPDELAEVEEAVARHLDGAATTMAAPPSPRTSYKTKNALNKMSPEYAKALRPGRITPAMECFGSTSVRDVEIDRCKQKEKRYR